MRTMNDRNWFSPVTLSRENPVAEFEVDSGLTDTHLLNDMRCFHLKIFRTSAVPVTGIDHHTVRDRVCFRKLFNVIRILCNDLNNGKPEFFGEFKVTVIMSRYAHDSASTVISEDIV